MLLLHDDLAHADARRAHRASTRSLPTSSTRRVRYWTLRTRRASYFVGKWLGLWATVSAVTFAMHALIWIVVHRAR